jgi:DNA helicase-2/ATP-dependent DNA helicase PcrA
VENLDLQMLFGKIRLLENSNAATRLQLCLSLASDLMTGINVDSICARCTTITNGRARNPPSDSELAAIAFIESGNWADAKSMLERLAREDGKRVFRWDAMRLVMDSLTQVTVGQAPDLSTAAATMRERRRQRGRRISQRSVGSTLLLKGLEAEYVIALDVEDLSAANLYVALTRATRGILIFSASQWLAGPPEIVQ